MGPDGRFKELADELAQAADAIRSEIPIRFSRLASFVEAAREEWAASCNAAAAAGITSLSADEFDLAGLRTALIELARRRRIAALIARVSRALEIAHRTDAKFEPLSEVAQRVSRDSAAIEAEADPVPILAPFEALEMLIEEGSSLLDEQADELHATVAAEFGSKLALAAVRGRLYYRTPRPPNREPEPLPLPLPPMPTGLSPRPPIFIDQRPAEPAPAMAAAPTFAPEATIAHPEPAAVIETPAAVTETPAAAIETPAAAAVEEIAPPEPVAEVAPAAAAAPPAAAAFSAVALPDGAWHALERGRPGLAWQLANGSGAPAAASGLCAILALAAQADGSGLVDGLAARRSSDLWGTAAGLAYRDPFRIVALLAAVRLAVLAPASGAAALREASREGDAACPALMRIASAAADLVATGQTLVPAMLAGTATPGFWQDRIAETSQAAQRWLDRQATASLRSSRVTDVWRNWVGSERPVGRMVRIVASDRRADRGEAHDTRASLETELEALLVRTDHALHGVRAARTPPDSLSKELLAERVEQARALVRRWEALLDAATAGPSDRVAALRGAVLDGRSGLQAEIEAATAGHAAMHRVALAQLEELVQLLRGNPSVAPVTLERLQDLPQAAALDVELLLLPDLDLDGDLRPLAGAPDPAAIEAAADQSDWSRAFAQRIERRDFPGAAICLDALGQLGQSDPTSLREWWQTALAKARQAIERRQIELLHQLTGAAATEQLDEIRQLELEAAIRSALPAPFDDVRAADRVLGAIADQLGQLAARARDEAERKLDSGEFSGASQSAVKRIRQIIRSGRLELANSYMDRLQQGGELPKHDELASVWASAFPLFFGPFIDQANALHRARGSLASIRDAVSTAPRFLEPLEALGGDEPLRREALDLLDAWELAKRRGDDEAAKGVQRLFELLKFRAPKLFKYLAPPRSAVTATLHLQCALINDRNVVVIPAFGSAAQGHYRIVLLWGNLTAQQMASRIVESVSLEGGPIVVLCFRAIDRTERMALARLAATSQDAPLMVLDEALILFLAQYPSAGRLKAFFDCTLPFTAIDPYLPEGAPLPPEFFFGRQEERERILAADESGSVLVYGAPRLGKTALLRHIEAEHATDAKERSLVVRYVDIRGLGRGPMSPPRGVTRLIAEQLKAAGVPVAAGDGHPDFERKVRDWLEEGASVGRRIVILLDDADAFLRKDAEDGYPELRQLRQLMDATRRRFKFVLAGTQAVQHLAHDPQSPLAGCGPATTVGKLRRGADLRDAERLVRQPLETMGFSFPAREAVSLILAHCDGDPGLIQTFCARLLAGSRRRFVANPESALPFPIGIEEVASLYAEPEIGAAVAARLHAALDLDGRYHYVSRLIALVCAGDERRAIIDGLALGDLHDQAMMDWPEGFGDSTGIEEFRILLDEMVELGLLRRTGHETYALRYPNVPQPAEEAEKPSDAAPPAEDAGATPRRRQRHLQEAGASA